jgi:hypothetical protein
MDYSKLVVLIVIIILLLIAIYIYDTLENFENLIPTQLPSSSNLLDSYPIIDKLNENTTELWKTNPVMTKPSYSQTTNNIKYPSNPDNGTCSQLELCNAFYGNINTNQLNTNEIKPSMDVNPNKVRVGYFSQ